MKKNLHEVCVITRCPFCGRANEIEVNEIDYFDWDDGVKAQDAFPYLSDNEREMLISGICPTCWDSWVSTIKEENDNSEEFWKEIDNV